MTMTARSAGDMGENGKRGGANGEPKRGTGKRDRGTGTGNGKTELCVAATMNGGDQKATPVSLIPAPRSATP